MSPLSLRNLAVGLAALAAAVAAAVAGAAPALARGGPGGGRDPEVRVAGTCGTGATSSLRVRSRDGVLETQFTVWGRATATWSLTLVHERQIAWRGRRRATGASHSFSFGYRLPDFSGADAVSVRAVGPRGVACWASATLPS
jgi:hypothetical protein